MAIVLLIMPGLPQKNGAPYIGQQYVAASLLRDGHEVRCVDLAAVGSTNSEEDLVALAEALAPDMIGMTLFTQNAARGYALAKKLRHAGRLLAAGGPHATVLPNEALENGFEVAVCGEGERVAVLLARWLDKKVKEPFPEIAGCHTQGVRGLAWSPIENLDDLPFPHESYPCFDEKAYSPEGIAVIGGMITSRGCPAQCTFCANYVTGRSHQWRSAANVIEEMKELRVGYNVRHFSIWDDAFAAKHSRVEELCEAMLKEYTLNGVTWSCNTPANMVNPEDLALMRKAGCAAVNFGIESGDKEILKIIKKGQRPDQIKKAVAAAKAVGMTTIVNFMFGFPEEGIAELNNTLRLMTELADDADYFNHRGTLTPFPGTAIYDQYHDQYGFSEWWLNSGYVPDEPSWAELDPEQVGKYLEHDPVLDLDFFHYANEVREKIAECIVFKAKHNQHAIMRTHDTCHGVTGSRGNHQ